MFHCSLHVDLSLPSVPRQTSMFQPSKMCIDVSLQPKDGRVVSLQLIDGVDVSLQLKDSRVDSLYLKDHRDVLLRSIDGVDVSLQFKDGRNVFLQPISWKW